MATIGSLTAINGTPDDYAVIENGNGNFKEKALFVVEGHTDIISGGASASVTLDQILLAYYNYIITNYGKRAGHYVFAQAWAGHSGGIELSIDVSLYQGQYPYMYGQAIMQTGGVYAFLMTPTSGSDPTPIVKKAQLAATIE